MQQLSHKCPDSQDVDDDDDDNNRRISNEGVGEVEAEDVDKEGDLDDKAAQL